MSHYASMSFFSFSGRGNKWWAFKQMQLAKEALMQAEGSSFIKLMGCGSNGGFSIWPDFGTYALFAVWDHPKSFQVFLDRSSIAAEFKDRAAEHFHLLMKPYRSHGSWSGLKPFSLAEGSIDERNKRIAVITRATINYKKIVPFWKLVPSVGRGLKNRVGHIISMGMGEWPLFELTTFSVWDGSESMQKFAYQSGEHGKAIKQTRAKSLFVEDLFARFEVLKMEGLWKGVPMSYGQEEDLAASMHREK